ncbi:MAG: hypothetical protein R3E12_15870 [Candidatus Eisenbacteria bacterium]
MLSARFSPFGIVLVEKSVERPGKHLCQGNLGTRASKQGSGTLETQFEGWIDAECNVIGDGRLVAFQRTGVHFDRSTPALDVACEAAAGIIGLGTVRRFRHTWAPVVPDPLGLAMLVSAMLHSVVLHPVVLDPAELFLPVFDLGMPVSAVLDLAVLVLAVLVLAVLVLAVFDLGMLDPAVLHAARTTMVRRISALGV